MNNLLKFFAKYHVLFLFLLIEIGCLVLILKRNEYQRSAFFSSSNVVVSSTYSISNQIVEFFSLRSSNASLAEENIRLQNQIIALENRLTQLAGDSSQITPSYIAADSNIKYISAKIINNSTLMQKNYMTINKGLRDGVKPDMGVVCADGAVGVVKSASEKFAVIIPILNSDLSINSKFKSTNYVGPIRWNGLDYRYAQLHDIARHAEVHIGDTIVSSGFASAFPAGIPIGVVEERKLEESDSYYDIQVRLNANFKTITYVQVIANYNIEEQQKLEMESKR